MVNHRRLLGNHPHRTHRWQSDLAGQLWVSSQGIQLNLTTYHAVHGGEGSKGINESCDGGSSQQWCGVVVIVNAGEGMLAVPCSIPGPWLALLRGREGVNFAGEGRSTVIDTYASNSNSRCLGFSPCVNRVLHDVSAEDAVAAGEMYLGMFVPFLRSTLVEGVWREAGGFGWGVGRKSWPEVLKGDVLSSMSSWEGYTWSWRHWALEGGKELGESMDVVNGKDHKSINFQIRMFNMSHDWWPHMQQQLVVWTIIMTCVAEFLWRSNCGKVMPHPSL